MDSVVVRKVKQLPSEEKRSLESLVGRALEDNQQVFILAFTPSLEPDEKARQEAMHGLAQTWEKVEKHMLQHGITDEEFDSAVDKAADEVRCGK